MGKRALVILVTCAACTTTAAPDADRSDWYGWLDVSFRDASLVDRGFTSEPELVVPCGHAGLASGRCFAGACQATLHCWDPAAFAAGSTTVQGALGVEQGDPADPAHPGYQTTQTPQRATDSAPFNAWAGTFCAQECDATATIDTCGSCTACSRTLTQMPLLATLGGVGVSYGDQALFPTTSEGVCRLQCTFDPATRGAECDAQHTCEPFDGVCVEACTTDNECNTEAGVTYSGALVTIVNADQPAHCNMTTGRCEYAGTTGAHIGSTCNGTNDCAPTTGVCIDGGLCAEFNACTPGQGCGMGNSGVCLTANHTMHSQTICVQGCSATPDCSAGNVCEPLQQPIGGHMGYCFGQCMSDDQCHADETCTDYTTTDPLTGAAVAHPGECVHRCGGAGAPITVGAIGASVGTLAAGDCLTTEFCEADHAGASYGACAPVSHLCGASNTNSLQAAATDCPTGQLCDETLATPHRAPTTAAPHGPILVEHFGDGHCTEPCSSGVCTAPAECIGSGALAGLCRQPCTMDAMGSCPQDQHCDTAIGYCVECPTNVPRGMTPPANCM